VTLPDVPDRLDSEFPDSTVTVAAAAASLVFAPVLEALERRGRPFTGLLYAGLMLTRGGPKVVEFNCRFGDPETEALMPVLHTQPRLIDLMRTVAEGRPLPEVAVRMSGACVTTVLAAANYPGTPRTGDPITLPPRDEGVQVFHAGTARDAEGRLVTAGGRVLAVSAVAPTVAEAQRRSQDHAARIEFAGKQHRTDIGWREVARQQPPRARAPRD
jgi:phosphoribosylamine--glycine ligase